MTMTDAEYDKLVEQVFDIMVEHFSWASEDISHEHYDEAARAVLDAIGYRELRKADEKSIATRG
jgi:hypothetical protein